MAILIEGMEMPKEDEEIIIRIDSFGTVMTEYALPIVGVKAVPVQPHGRLIDADALYSYIKDEQRKCNYPCDGWSECQVALGFVNSAPTVISASEEG